MMFRGRGPEDIVPPDGYYRGILDRDIRIANDNFATMLGREHAPLDVSANIAQATGRIALLDAGCGTGNTLRTWREELLMRVPTLGYISAIGVNLPDYSNESMHDETIEAIEWGYIDYRVRDVQRKMGIEDESIDVALSYMVLALQRPVNMLNGMIRAVRPGGSVYATFYGDDMRTNQPLAERLQELQDQGYQSAVDTRPSAGSTPGRPIDLTFVRLQKPGIILPE
jgi:SAM-dependent methyltransferase